MNSDHDLRRAFWLGLFLGILSGAPIWMFISAVAEYCCS